jgi:hypothetical protein
MLLWKRENPYLRVNNNDFNLTLRRTDRGYPLQYIRSLNTRNVSLSGSLRLKLTE